MLVEMIQKSESHQSLSKPERLIQLTLARSFEERTDNLFYTPEELQMALNIGTKEQWHEFLNKDVVQLYIKTQMAAVAQISQRKTFKSLVESALSGNAQAAKQVQDLSGVLNSVDTNKVIILHHIPRPNKNINKEVVENGG